MKKFNKLFGYLLVGMAIIPSTALALSKTETIYTNLDSDGNVTKSVVNNHLKINSKEKIEDETILSDIMNINGDEKFTLNNNNLIWDALGEDIFYSGVTDKKLPIDISIAYYLDGEKKEYKDIVGKSGHIDIEYKFINNVYNNYNNLYTPFVVTLGSVFNNKDVSNISVSNGKVVDTGTKSVIVGMASPGLYDNLLLEEFKNFDSIKISYDTKKFKYNDIYVVSTPKMIEDNDFKIFDKLDSLSNKSEILRDGINKLEEGAKKLEDGASRVSNGATTINENLNEVIVSIGKLEDGSNLMNGYLEMIIEKVNNINALINDKDISCSLANLDNLKNGNNTAIDNLNSVNMGLSDVYNNYKLGSFEDTSSMKLYFKSIGLDDDTINDLVNCKKTYDGNLSLINLLSLNNSAIDTTINDMNEILGTVSSISELSSNLSKILYIGTNVSDGLDELKNGVSMLYDGSTMLKDGSIELYNGTKKLTSGIDTLNNDGISVITSYTDKISGYSYKINEMVRLSNNYKGYASDNASNTMFIYKIGE